MSKKKKGKIVQLNSNQLSPEKYIQTQARSLPILECLINEDWESAGIANVLVARQHKTGNITYALYLVDMYCLGVKDVNYNFNVDPDHYADLKYAGPGWLTIDYVLAHNIIYGGIEYAEDYDFKPHKDFTIARFILEEDDEAVELMELEFGLDGKPCYVQGPYDDPVKVKNIMATLERTAGKDNFTMVEEDDEDLDDDWDGDWEDEDFDEELEAEMEEYEREEEKRSFKIILGGLKKINNAYDELVRSPEAKEILENSTIGSNYKLTKDVLKTQYNTFENDKQDAEIYNYADLIFTEHKYEQAITSLKEGIKRYPGKAVLRNLLRSAYVFNDQPEKANDTITETYKLFPDYLLAKLNYANMLFEIGESEKIIDVYDGKLDLDDIYPGSKKFNRTEVSSYYVSMCRYFIEAGDLDAADLYMNAIIKKKVYDEHSQTMVKYVMTHILQVKLKKIEEYRLKSQQELF